MCWLYIIICSCLLFFTVSSCAGIGLGNAKIVVQVIDDNQTPVEEAKVTFSFRNYP